MSDMGYLMYPQGGLTVNYDQGTPDQAVSLEQQAALQLDYHLMNCKFMWEGKQVPPSYMLQAPSNITAVTPRLPVYGHLPVLGWTAQNDQGNPGIPFTGGETSIVEPPSMMVMPDWTADVNPIGAGAYDQTSDVNTWAYNVNNQVPLGNDALDGYASDGAYPPNSAPFATAPNLNGDIVY